MYVASLVCPLVKPGVEEIKFFRAYKLFITNCRKVKSDLNI